MTDSTKLSCKLLAMLLCIALVLSGTPITLTAAGTEALPAVAEFDAASLDALQYPHGTVSAWLEYDCGNGIMKEGLNKSYLQVSVGTDYNHFSAYCQSLAQNSGYTQVQLLKGSLNTPVSSARYLAADGSHTVYVYILNALQEVRVIVDTNRDMTGSFAGGFVYESTTGETAQPMLTMYGLSMAENGYSIDTGSHHVNTFKVNSGALLVIRMPDNSLFINDGGSVEQWNEDACHRFMAFLRQMTGKAEGETVTINTWFLSHAHTDHFEGFTRFVDHYHDQLDVKNVMYNIDSERLGTARDLTYLLKLFRAYYPSVKYYKPHTGEHFSIAGVEFDVVYAHEDRFYPTENGQEMVIDHLDGKSEYAQHGSRNGTYRPECFQETVYSYDSQLVATPTTFDYSDFNDTSTVLKVNIPKETTGADKDFTALLYGDVNRVDQTMLTVYSGTDMLKADMMLVPHHGHDAHPELAQVSEATVFLYTQRKCAIYGPNGIVDYGVDISGTYRPALVCNYMAMQSHLEKSKIYWQGTETVCLTFGADAQNLPSGMEADSTLSADTGIYAYTCPTIAFPYEGWPMVTVASPLGGPLSANAETTTSRIRFDQVTTLSNEGRYLIVHDQTDNILMYNAIAKKSGQTKPNLATSVEIGSGQAASDGLVDAYYKVTDTAHPEVETKTSIYCTRDKRDAALWILGQNGVSGAGTTLTSASAKFGGSTAYNSLQLYKGTSSQDAYWYSTEGKDYVDSSTGNQWRYLHVSSNPVFYKSATSANTVEFFSDGTCLIYSYSSASSVRFLTVTPEGNWVRQVYKESQLTDSVLASLKLRLYEYKTRSGAKTIAYSGPAGYSVYKGADSDDVVNTIAATFSVTDPSARNRPIPCSGTTPKVGCYWLDGTFSTASLGSTPVPVNYRNDDGTDTLLCTLTLDVKDRVYLATVLSSTTLTIPVGQDTTDSLICDVFSTLAGYETIDTRITLSMLTDAAGNAVTADTEGTLTGLTLTDNGKVLSTDIALEVGEESIGHPLLTGGSYVSGVQTQTADQNIDFTLLTAAHRPRYGERYLMVHHKTGSIMSYSAVAKTPGQAAPNTPVSLTEYATAGTSESGHVQTIYLSHHLRDEALWIIAQTKKEAYGTLEIAKGDELSYINNGAAVSTYLGGDSRYHHAWLYKGVGPVYNADGTVADTNNGMYWKSVSGNDAEGQQWRYLRLDEEDMFGLSKVSTNIESFSDDTFIIYYKDGDNYHVPTLNADGTWSYQILTAEQVAADLENLKVRLYKYGNDSGSFTVSYAGMQECYVPLGTPLQTVLSYIATSITVTDAAKPDYQIPCSGTTPQIGLCWLEADFATDTPSEGTVTVKYRNNDATDTVIATIRMDIK